MRRANKTNKTNKTNNCSSGSPKTVYEKATNKKDASQLAT